MSGVYVYPPAGASSTHQGSYPTPVPYNPEMAGVGLMMPVPAGYPTPAFGPVAASTVTPTLTYVKKH